MVLFFSFFLIFSPYFLSFSFDIHRFLFLIFFVFLFYFALIFDFDYEVFLCALLLYMLSFAISS